MSADNWTVCPRCQYKIQQEQERLLARVQVSYGKVPEGDYLYLLKKAKQAPVPENVLREDYNVGITDGGTFYVNYRCECTRCGFTHAFKQEQQLDLSQPVKREE